MALEKKRSGMDSNHYKRSCKPLPSNQSPDLKIFVLVDHLLLPKDTPYVDQFAMTVQAKLPSPA